MSKPRGPHTAEAARREVVRAIRAGELTRAAAATRLGVSRQSIYRWLSSRASKERLPSRFVAVELTRPEVLPPSAPLPDLVEITLREGRVLRVPLSVDAEALGRFVRGFEAAC